MKQRVISALVGLAIFFVILASYGTFVIELAVYIIMQMMVFELLQANKLNGNKALSILSYITSTAVFVPMSNPWIIGINSIGTSLVFLIFLLFLCYVGLLLRYHREIPFEKMTVMGANSVLVAISLGSLVSMDIILGYQLGLYLTMIVFCCAWGSDTGAYFAGRFLGKKKLAPVISPKKTIEGVYGGVCGCLFFVALVTVIYSSVCSFYDNSFELLSYDMFYIKLAIISMSGSLIGVCGDLLASVVKRQCNIKDYGTIMPGHGGVLDRFDSVLLVAPTVYVLFLVLFTR